MAVKAFRINLDPAHHETIRTVAFHNRITTSEVYRRIVGQWIQARENEDAKHAKKKAKKKGGN